MGSKIFSTFIGFLKNKDQGDGTEQALLDELSTFNDYIKENLKGPLINGEKISAADFVLSTKVIPHEDCIGTLQELNVFSRESFAKTRAQREDVIAGWRPKVMG